MAKTKVATSEIIAFFNSSAQRVYTKGELKQLFWGHSSNWRTSAVSNADKFVEFLVDNTNFRLVSLESHKYSRLDRYVWGSVSPYLLALSIEHGSYLSHGTAVFLHALTDVIPKTIYANHEQSIKPRPRGTLSQEALSRAFSNKQRRSNYVFQYEDWRLVLLRGKNSGRLGVVSSFISEGESLQATGLERTLVDIVVRPEYAGGVHHVLQAYKAARARMSVNVLLAHLRKLDYIYPYHQAIGFYMEKAGYERDRLQRLKKLPQRFDFYLAHGIQEKAYDPTWRLFFPKGLE